MPYHEDVRIGIHTSRSGSLEKSALKAHELGANTFQIFSASPRMWRAVAPVREDIHLFRRAREKHDLAPLAVHVSYLINLASLDPIIRAKSIAGFRGELERAAMIGAEYLVLHPGSYKGQSLQEGIAAFVAGMAEAAEGLPLNGLTIDTLMSHLACADEESPSNAMQLAAFAGLRERFPATTMSLANSAGIALGEEYHFDLTRPGLAIYGGIPREEMGSFIRQVARIEAQVVQRRQVPAGGRVGYGGTYVCPKDTELAILNIGYADGYLRAFSGRGFAFAGSKPLPVVGRVSMDLTAIRVDDVPEIAEGDWLEIAFDLRWASQASGLSQYELLTTLGRRYLRRWT